MSLGYKFLLGLAIGLCINLFLLANSPNLPFLAYLAMYAYCIGVVFGWEKMKGWLAKACGVGLSIDYWLLIMLFIRRNGFMWGLILLLLYIAFILTIGLWWGIILAFVETGRYFTGKTDFSLRDSSSLFANKNVFYLCAGAVIIGIAATSIIYWPKLFLSYQSNIMQEETKLHSHVMPNPHNTTKTTPQYSNGQVKPAEKRQPTSTSGGPSEDWLKKYALQISSYQYKQLSGRWQGTYIIGNRKRSLVIEVKNKNSTPIATFTFSTNMNPTRADHGQFTMHCCYRSQDGQYYLIENQWIERPRNYQMVSMRGKLKDSKFVGDILDTASGRSIGSFDLTRVN